MIHLHSLLLIVLSPLIASVVSGFWGTRFMGPLLPRAVVHTMTILGVAISFLLSCQVLNATLEGAVFNQTVYEWMTIGSMKLEIGFLVDTLTAGMMCVVTFVSLMVHIYTIGYMHDDEGYNRFFSYLSLFTFAMLMLVMSNNLVQLFFGWEAVGLVSYLLIGFWFKKPTAVFANMKAFLVNRVGDFGFLLGIGLLVSVCGSLNYTDIFAKRDLLVSAGQIPTIFGMGGWSIITTTCICLFIGAMAKSAQFPLHVWLPDSMEGPTPISALIHAATMVTAGIFMVSRMSPLFELSDVALNFILIVGSVTALFMGLLGIVQNDIKRVVAYSTLSQLGYMTVALGASAYSLAIFHLMTHAFFKALLFLGAGSVIIGMHHEQDMRNMGGLFKKMPVTAITSLIGSLALIGTPFLSGFYSKDLIIEAIKHVQLPAAQFAYYAVLIGVFVTAFYSFRMFFLVFMGPPRWQSSSTDAEHHGKHEPHESPMVVTIPLILLAIPSILIGALSVKDLVFGSFFAKGSAFPTVLHIDVVKHPAVQAISHEFHGAVAMGIHAFSTMPFVLAVLGVVSSAYLYLFNPSLPKKIASTLRPLVTLLENKYYLDAFNQQVIARLALLKGQCLWWFDRTVIDGLVNLPGKVLMALSQFRKNRQTGYVFRYAGVMLVGLLVLFFLNGLFPFVFKN